MKEIVFIKYGGSIITDKSRPQSVSVDCIRQLNEQVKYLHSISSYLFIIGNGGGAFGHYFAMKYGLGCDKEISPEAVFGICEGKNGNNYLNHLIVDDLLNIGVSAASVRISTPYLLLENLKAWEELCLYLGKDILPVLYGDILIVENEECRIVSTEQAFLDLARYIAHRKKDTFKIRKFIFCTDTDGIKDKIGNRIPKISADFYDDSLFWNSDQVYDVTGGMKKKVEISLELAKIAPVQIINGKKKDAVIQAVAGEEIGTQIGI